MKGPQILAVGIDLRMINTCGAVDFSDCDVFWLFRFSPCVEFCLGDIGTCGCFNDVVEISQCRVVCSGSSICLHLLIICQGDGTVVD